MYQAGARILVVEDDLNLKVVLAEFLQGLGYSVDGCNNGKEAVTRITAGIDYHLVITDIVMPKLDGMSLLKKVARCCPETAVILITGHASLDSTLAAIKTGACDYILKPFKLEQMEIAVRKALDRRDLSVRNKELAVQLKAVRTELDLHNSAEKALEKRVKELEDRVESEHKALREAVAAAVSFGTKSTEKVGEAPCGKDVVSDLEKLETLKQRGILSEEEFSAGKTRILLAATSS